MTINRYEGESRFCIQVFERETNGANAREGNPDSRLMEKISDLESRFLNAQRKGEWNAKRMGQMRGEAILIPG